VRVRAAGLGLGCATCSQSPGPLLSRTGKVPCHWSLGGVGEGRRGEKRGQGERRQDRAGREEGRREDRRRGSMAKDGKERRDRKKEKNRIRKGGKKKEEATAKIGPGLGYLHPHTRCSQLGEHPSCQLGSLLKGSWAVCPPEQISGTAGLFRQARERGRPSISAKTHHTQIAAEYCFAQQ
jgi:hypothetical protein